ncbi:putative serine/threonine-protein kinase [Heracleum sosnowskyi]|uniref:Serine/threonine-protein kinase n=1 Tax=Heracleum sosnowskyi TaxID=360622 RepID=A0AAD8IKV9_9APIA|nr:putative serine/threonine-protein kinase [Heracleum sosnowskyi]
MNNYGDRENKGGCYFHPTEVVIGVCHFCLHERLIVLASKQTHHSRRGKSRTNVVRNHSFSHDQKPPANVTSLPKIFAIGSLLNRFEFRHRKSDDQDFSDASSSHEDSFISIKFENNNGVGSWEKNANTVSKVSLEHCNFSWNHSLVSNEGKGSTKTVVEHVKPRAATLRWRKRIGHLFQLGKWKRSSKASACHVGGKLEGAKVRNSGWIRSLTKRRTKE